jgi:hypothetical protein
MHHDEEKACFVVVRFQLRPGELGFGRYEWLELVAQGELHYAGVGEQAAVIAE